MATEFFSEFFSVFFSQITTARGLTCLLHLATPGTLGEAIEHADEAQIITRMDAQDDLEEESDSDSDESDDVEEDARRAHVSQCLGGLHLATQGLVFGTCQYVKSLYLAAVGLVFGRAFWYGQM